MGGAEKLLVDLLPELRRMGDDVSLLCFNGVRTDFYDQLETCGIRTYSFGSHGVYHPSQLYKLWRLLRRERFDVVHTHNTAPQLFAAIVSLLVSVTLFTTEHSTSNRRRAWPWFRPVDRWMYGRYRRVICISEVAQQQLLAHLSGLSNTCVIPNGIRLSAYADDSSEGRPCTELRTQGGRYNCIMAARFRHPKDQMTVIKALARLSGDYHLWFAGVGDTLEDCQALVAQLGLEARVHFLGFRRDIPALLKGADVVILSSAFEGMPLAALEGMASGHPLLASNVPGIREVVSGYGLLFPYGDDRKLAELIEKVCTDESLRLATVSRCRERAAQYDIARTARAYHDEYRRADNSL